MDINKTLGAVVYHLNRTIQKEEGRNTCNIQLFFIASDSEEQPLNDIYFEDFEKKKDHYNYVQITAI